MTMTTTGLWDRSLVNVDDTSPDGRGDWEEEVGQRTHNMGWGDSAGRRRE